MLARWSRNRPSPPPRGRLCSGGRGDRRLGAAGSRCPETRPTGIHVRVVGWELRQFDVPPRLWTRMRPAAADNWPHSRNGGPNLQNQEPPTNTFLKHVGRSRVGSIFRPSLRRCRPVELGKETVYTTPKRQTATQRFRSSLPAARRAARSAATRTG
jgi:hypothetical protein